MERFLAVLAVLSLFSCQKEELSVSVHEFHLGANGGQISFSCIAGAPVSCIVGGEAGRWIELLSKEALASRFVILYVKPNDTTYGREGTLTVTSGSLSETIKVYQEGVEPRLTASADQRVLRCEGDSLVVSVSGNIDASCVIPDGCGWLHLANTKATSSGIWTLFADANESEEPRQVTVSFQNDDRGVSDEIIVRQEGYCGSVLSIRVDTTSFLSPVFVGCDLRGMTAWGDGTVQPYDSTTMHSYAAGTEHVATFSVYGADAVTIPVMTGVRHLDLTKFCRR